MTDEPDDDVQGNEPNETDDEWYGDADPRVPDARSWGGQNVFDVYTKSEGTALDGTKYRDW